MTEFKYFRHALTGKIGSYPEDFGDLFYDLFTEVDPNEAECVDCWIKPEDESDEDDFKDFDFEDAPDPVVALSPDKNEKGK